MSKIDHTTLNIFPDNDLAFARFMHDYHERRLLYVDSVRQWYYWNERHWQQVSSTYVMKLAQETAEHLSALVSHENTLTEKQRRRILSCMSHTRKKAMIQELQGIVLTDVARFDSKPYLFNFANGTYDLKTDIFRPHKREDYLSLSVTYPYDPSASYESFMGFLCVSLGGRADLITFMQEIIGYFLFGGNPEQIVIFLAGNGKNGKSTLVSILRALLGPYAGGILAATLLASSRNDAKRSELAQHRKTRLLAVSELPERRKLNEAAIKAMSGEDEITACLKYRDAFHFVPEFTPLFTGNRLPTVTGGDEGIWRRWIFMTWDAEIPEEKRNKNLRHELTQPEALSGIFNFALEGYKRYQQRGAFDIPSQLEQIKQEYRKHFCTLAPFIREECWTTTNTGYDPNALKTPVGQLFYRYKARCTRNLEPYMEINEFSRKLNTYGFPTSRGEQGLRYKLGIIHKNDYQ